MLQARCAHACISRISRRIARATSGGSSGSSVSLITPALFPGGVSGLPRGYDLRVNIRAQGDQAGHPIVDCVAVRAGRRRFVENARASSISAAIAAGDGAAVVWALATRARTWMVTS